MGVNEKPESYQEAVQSLGVNLTRYGHGFQFLVDLVKKQSNRIDSLTDSLATF